MRSSYHLRWRQGVLLLIQQFKWKITFLLLAASYLINVLIWRSRHVTSYNCPWSLLAGAVTRNDSKKRQAPPSVLWGDPLTRKDFTIMPLAVPSCSHAKKISVLLHSTRQPPVDPLCPIAAL